MRERERQRERARVRTREIEKETDRDLYMTAQQAKEYGIIDNIIEGRNLDLKAKAS